MGMSDFYGAADETECIATIHAAIDAGITLLDTGDYYAAGHNELLIGQALRGRDRDAIAISVKFGFRCKVVGVSGDLNTRIAENRCRRGSNPPQRD
jgi:aryl-alcohol dehydrogenase-like predicted oxidoreductase